MNAKQTYTNWENTQCATCEMCQGTKGNTMSCEVFIAPYFVWGKYRLNDKKEVFILRDEPHKAPDSCFAYCGTRGEYKDRVDAMKRYQLRKGV